MDEVAELPMALQGKLLRVLQEREYYRVGGLKKIKLDARIICATNQPLEECMAKGSFRRDLYYRLKVGHIVIPPLRRREAEIALLAQHLLREVSRKKRGLTRTLHPDALRLLESYDWPGNVRELRNLMELVVFATQEQELRAEHFAIQLNQANCVGPAREKSYSGEGLSLPLPAQGYSLKNYVNEIIRQVLAAHGGNQTVTAKYLGISRRALSYRLENQQADLDD